MNQHQHSPAEHGLDRPWQPPQLAVVVPSFNECDNITLLYERIAAALSGIPFEIIVVDDNSPDGTADVVRALARRHASIRIIHRIGRRGLSSAVIEGMSSTAAPYVAVIDADLQHDESVLPQLYRRAVEGADVVVATRYAGSGSAGDGLSAAREQGSRFATRLATALTGTHLSDPMSGFFLMNRDVFTEVAPRLSRDGFKILLDIIVSATRFRARTDRELTIVEVPYTFRARNAGESKMGPLIVIQFMGLLLSKLTHGLLPTSFLLFSMVGSTGVIVHLAVLALARDQLGLPFAYAQLSATIVAMTTNFILNNELTYSDKRLRGIRFFTGLLIFYLVCSFGTLANVSIATWVYQGTPNIYVAGIAGAVMSVVFNYAVTRVFTWR